MSMLLVSCTSVPLASDQMDQTAKQFRPLSGQGRVYVLRKKEFKGSGLDMKIYFDRKDVANLRPGTYTVIDARLERGYSGFSI